MSFSTPQTIAYNGTLTSAEDLEGKEGYVVYINASSQVYLADSTDYDFGTFFGGDTGNNWIGGILIDGGSGSGARVQVGIGVCWAVAAATLYPNQSFTNSATAAVVDGATQANDRPLGVVLQGGASGEKVLVNYTGPAIEKSL